MSAQASRYSGIVEKLFVVVVALAAIWTILPCILNFPVTGPDAYDHLHWITQIIKLKNEEVFYPRWMGDSYDGYGWPVFYFYPILPYIAAWLVSLLGKSLSIFQIYNITAVLILIASSVSGFLYFKRYARSRAQALAASLLYIALPYRFLDLHVRASFSEQFVFIWIPLIFLAIDKALAKDASRKVRIGSTLLLAISWTALVLTNVPSLAMMTVVVPIYTIIRWIGQPKPEQTFNQWMPILSGLVIALLLSAIYLLPALTMRSLIHTDFLYAPLGIDYFYAIYDVFASNSSNLFFFPACMMLLGAIAAAAFLSSYRKGLIHKSFLPWLMIVLLTVFLQIPIVSVPIWKYFPLFNLIQFSTRFSVLLCIGIPIAYLAIPTGKSRTLMLLSMMVLMLFCYKKSVPGLEASWAEKPIDPNGVIARDPPEYQPISAGTDFLGQHTAAIRDTTAPEIVASNLQPGDSISIKRRLLDETDFHAHLSRPTAVQFHRLYWPTWKLSAEYGALSLGHDSIGRIIARLPAGDYDATLQIALSPIERTGEWVSGFGVLVVIGLTVTWIRSRTRHD